MLHKNNVSKDEIEQAKRMDLLTYLQNHEPHELVKVNGNTYSTRTNDSLKISNGRWFRWSRGVGGRSALDYLIKVRDMPFMDAVRHMNDLSGFVAEKPTYTKSPPPKQPLRLPKAFGNSNRVLSYLAGRGIDLEVLNYCIDNGLLYEDAQHHNCVFIGKNRDGKAQYGMIRSSNHKSTFLRDADGSDKRYSFRMVFNEKADTVHLFESAIDLLSYATLVKMHGRDWKNINYLSLSGVYQPKEKLEESALPVALAYYLRDYPVEHVAICFDNDKTGHIAAKAITALMNDRYDYSIELCFPTKGKDYNLELHIEKGIPVQAKMRGDIRRDLDR